MTRQGNSSSSACIGVKPSSAHGHESSPEAGRYANAAADAIRQKPREKTRASGCQRRSEEYGSMCGDGVRRTRCIKYTAQHVNVLLDAWESIISRTSFGVVHGPHTLSKTARQRPQAQSLGWRGSCVPLWCVDGFDRKVSIFYG